MFGHEGWRPLTVAALASGALLLPQGVAVAAEPAPPTCAQLGERLGADGFACTPMRHDGVDGVFLGAPGVPRSPDGEGSRSSASDDGPEAGTGGGTSAACPGTSGQPGPAGAAPATPDADKDAAEKDTDTEEAGYRGSGLPGAGPVAGLPGFGAIGAVAAATPGVVAEATDAAASVAGTVLSAAVPAAAAAAKPGDLIDLDQWYLTLPTGERGKPDTIENPELASFTNEFFKLNTARDGVVFSANGDGVTTKNSEYPRSELREMNGSEKAAWSNTSGTHTLTVCEAITKVPQAKPEVVAAQIHDGNDDVIQIRLEGKTLMIQYDDGESEKVIDPAYELGTPYQVKIVAANSEVTVFYNGKMVDKPLQLSGSGWYWKVGAYVQSNSRRGDGAESVGEVTVYSLDNVHA